MQQLESTLRDAWVAAWDQGDLDRLDRLVSSDYRRINTTSGRWSNIAQLKDEIALIREAFPDLTTSVTHVLRDGNQAAIHWRTEGTFTQPLGEVPPTGNTVVTTGANLATIENELLMSEEVTWDSGELLRDAGITSLASAFEEVQPSVESDPAKLPPREMLKSFNSQFVSGVTVVTALTDDAKPMGLAVSSYNSVSLDPPLVLFCVMKTSSTYPTLFKAKHVGINILGTSQMSVLKTFSSKDKNKFEQVTWRQGPNGSPLIENSVAAIEIDVKERFQAMTHTIFIGRVRHAETLNEAPMIYKAGQVFVGTGLQPLA